MKKPQFAAGDIYKKYANKVWVKDLPLDRICLRTKGLKDMIKKKEVVGWGYDDILSMPLSGAPETTLEPRDRGIKYVTNPDQRRVKQYMIDRFTSANNDPMKTTKRH